MESEPEATLSSDQDTATYFAPANQRPRSSLLVVPEKEPLNFTINRVGAPPEVEQLVEHIKSVAEQCLYHWKTFPLCEYLYIITPNDIQFRLSMR